MAWLAGLLEGEGTFLRPPPSLPRTPIVACRMTDRDVIERVAAMFGTSVQVIDKGRYRTEFAAVAKGSRAVALMQDLRHLMGERRRCAIDAALDAYEPPTRKLSYQKACEVRRRYAAGESISQLAHVFDVAHSTIRPILLNEIYKNPPPRPWRESRHLPALSDWDFLAPADLAWLAGWLEGEGSFLAPPPSSPRRPRVSSGTVDKDVAEKAGSLVGVTPQFYFPARARRQGWSPLWRLLVAGSKARALMRAVFNLCGERRRKQIQRALGETAAQLGSAVA